MNAGLAKISKRKRIQT